ncbi:MAG: anaerobic carbon-monoxide dehydrogenase catalytic subunit [Gammaproteobacteria bacterium]|nr:anaerobic carbon-monoxide dehydrogenase catalytic subunit [Gammaproteobacteria bacterium]
MDDIVHTTGKRDDPDLQLLNIAKAKGISTGRERLEAMTPQCGFGELGTCCRICYMGPCRIDPFGNGPKTGICGLSPDTMVARNLLRETVGGAASHVGHARHLLLNLRDAALGKAPYEIKNVARLKELAVLFGIAIEGRETKEICLDLVDIALEDFGRQDEKPNNWLSKRAPAKEQEIWKETGLMYSNPHNEIETALHASSMGNDAEPMTLLSRALKLGLVDGFSGLVLCTDIQDILFGTPQVTEVVTSVGVLEEHSVNLAVHGHNPVLSEKIMDWAAKLEAEAVNAGAEGINVVGVCCTGNELSMRHGVPLVAHNEQSELILMTGAVDCMVVDIQCIWPTLPQVAKCFDTAFITTDEMVHLPGAKHIEFEAAHNADEAAQEVVREAIAAFSKRKGKPVDIPNKTVKGIAGLSTEAIIGILSKVNAEDPLKPVIDAVASGAIQGFAGIAGCSSIKFRKEYMTEEMVKGLLKRDILVVTTGCTAQICGQDGLLTSEATLEHCGPGLKATLTALGEAAGLGGPLPPVWHMGSCVDNSRIGDLVAAIAQRLDVKISQLPAVGSAPELVQEKAISIGLWFVALGLTLHVAPPPRILGGPNVVKILTQDLEGLIGSRVFVENDPEQAAEAMFEVIQQKRKGLGL